MTNLADPAFAPARLRLRQNWGWLLALGIALVFLGTVGIGLSFLLTIASALMFGVLIFVGGVFQGIDAFREKGWGGWVLHLLIALLYIGTAILIFIDPVSAGITLTLLVGLAFVAVGILRVILAVQMRGSRSWVWVLVAGLISLGLGVMILAQWPASGLFVLGLFMAIELLIQGWSCIMIALAARFGTLDEANGTRPSAPLTPPAMPRS